MSNFEFYTKESAPDKSKPLLESAEKELGFIPNMFTGLAESPETLSAYQQLTDLFSNSSFTAEEQQLVLLTISTQHGCCYCKAAHATMAEKTTLTQEQIDTIQQDNQLGVDQYDALANFTKAVLQTRGNPSDDDMKRFRDAGYSNQHVLEVILAISMKTISNYSNHIMKTKVDEPFREQLAKAA